MTKIPFLDLIAPHEELKEELCEVFSAALRTGAFVGGPMVEAFEHDFAEFCETQHCVGVSSGTDAVRFALMAAGLRPGAIAVTVPNTFIATTEAITQAGGIPDFVDIDERTYNMDAEKLRVYLEEQCCVSGATGELVNHRSGRPVAAIVPVHLYGQTADMDPIMELAARYNLIVVEDACQAHGAEYCSGRHSGAGHRLSWPANSGISSDVQPCSQASATSPAPIQSRDREGAVVPDPRQGCWCKAGSMGAAGAFSFYPGKNLGACGEGGAVTTNDPELARKIRMLRDHGQSRKYYHDIEGYNGRLDAIQAGILSVKLKRLPEWNAHRREAAARYRDLFIKAGAGELAPYEPEWAKAIYHLYVILAPERDALIRRLADANIGTGIHYPVPLHLQQAYSHLGYGPGSFPVAEKKAVEILSLPMHPGLTYSHQSVVAEEVLAFVSPRRAVSVAGD